MIHTQESLCVGGNPLCANEDRMGWGENFLFVIDGATGLTGQKVMPFGSDAAWLAEGLAQHLTHSLPCPDRDLPAILQEAAAALKEDFTPRWQAANPGTPPDYPSAGVAIFRLRGHALEYIGLGDCPAVAELQNGQTQVLAETALTELDQIVLTEMARLTKATGCTMAQARAQVNDLLIDHRNRKNHPGGYWIFDPSGAGIPHARQFSWPREAVSAVSAMTDGFSQLVSPFGVCKDLSTLHRALRTQGAARLVSALFSAQEQDWGCEAFPRFKPRDDCTALFAEIRPR